MKKGYFFSPCDFSLQILVLCAVEKNLLYDCNLATNNIWHWPMTLSRDQRGNCPFLKCTKKNVNINSQQLHRTDFSLVEVIPAQVCLSPCKLNFCSHSCSSCCIFRNNEYDQALAFELSSPLPLRVLVSEMQNGLCGILG